MLEIIFCSSKSWPGASFRHPPYKWRGEGTEKRGCKHTDFFSWSDCKQWKKPANRRWNSVQDLMLLVISLFLLKSGCLSGLKRCSTWELKSPEMATISKNEGTNCSEQENGAQGLHLFFHFPKLVLGRYAERVSSSIAPLQPWPGSLYLNRDLWCAINYLLVVLMLHSCIGVCLETVFGSNSSRPSRIF